MSPRTGRPTNNPKTEQIKIRATKEDKALLEKCCKKMNQTQYDVVMNGIKLAYANIKFQEEDSMMSEYTESFDVDGGMPENCPICGAELNVDDNLDISPCEDGYLTKIICYSCGYEEEVSCTVEDDIEDNYIEEDNEEMSKEEMLEELEECGWIRDLTEESSWEEVKEVYDIMRDECFGESSLFPNGRDYDAEDEDGPF